MHLPHADLDVALAFVVERITQEAERSSVPLDDDEKHFLDHLPTEPTNPTAALAWGFNTTYECSWPTPVLRDFRFERLCKLARDAHSHDLQTRPDAAREREFAAAVLELHRHPMSWLLTWAGIRTGKRAARWDCLLLVTTAASVVVLFLVGVLALSVLTDGQKEVWKWTFWVVGACVYGTLVTLLFFAVRRLEAWQREQNIEICRRDVPMHGSAHTHR
ncbi:MAG: hypothetical protein WB799_06150 [Candidatus Sulfotelmatobacter sp.]